MATKFLEIATDAEADKVAEWMGRELARDAGKAYPIPCDRWIGPPMTPPATAFARFYAPRMALSGGGAVFVVDDEAQRFARQSQRLGDGSNYARNAASDSVPRASLTAAAQTALTAAGVP